MDSARSQFLHCEVSEMSRLIQAHFAGRIRPVDERRMRVHLPECASCRNLYERHQLLSQIDPLGIPTKERLGRGLGITAIRSQWLRSLSLVAVPSMIVAASVLILTFNLPEVAVFQSRGGAMQNNKANAIQVYQINHGNEPVRLSGVLHANDELAFAYQNPYGKRYLLVFGVDEHKEIYWYYPAWRFRHESPRAIPISVESGTHELPEAIRHSIRGSTLAIYAVFTDEELSVRSIEGLFDENAPFAARLPLKDAEQEISLFRVDKETGERSEGADE